MLCLSAVVKLCVVCAGLFLFSHIRTIRRLWSDAGCCMLHGGGWGCNTEGALTENPSRHPAPTPHARHDRSIDLSMARSCLVARPISGFCTPFLLLLLLVRPFLRQPRPASIGQHDITVPGSIACSMVSCSNCNIN